MRILRKLFCRMGFHRWRDTWRGSWNGWTQRVNRRCLDCDLSEGVTMISPWSGPNSGPMHPSVERDGGAGMAFATIGEICGIPPAQVDNIVREMMAQIKRAMNER